MLTWVNCVDKYMKKNHQQQACKLTQHRIYKNINEIILVPREGHMLEMPIINHDKEIRYEKFSWL